MRQRDDLVFSMSEFQRRLGAVRTMLQERELDALIVTTPENIFYLTGYQTSGFYCFQALVVPAESEPYMVTRLLEASNVDIRSWIEVSRTYSDTEQAITALRYSLTEFGLAEGRIGYERSSYFFRASEQDQLFTATPKCTYVDCSGFIEQLRLVKSEEELRYMRDAARATEAGMRAGLEAVATGRSENDVAIAIHEGMIGAGSEYPAVSPFVASGWRGAVGHASWEGRRIEADECVLLEVGGCVHRYHTALMRTAFTGSEPPPEVREAERYIQEAMQVSMELIRPGVAAGDVDAQNRYILDRYGHGSTQATRSGLSIGVAFAPHWGEGEAFSIQAGESHHFQENMTIYLVPWLQMPGRFGIGLSETLLVTAGGCEPLHNVERALVLR